MGDLLNRIVGGKIAKPRRTLLYGTRGIGKTTFASMAESPVILPTEEGTNDIECQRLPLVETFGQVMQAMAELYQEEHRFKTLVIDSLDWLEQLIWREVCSEADVASIEDIGYAKGYVFALKYWRQLLGALDAIRRDRGMANILIAHSRIVRFDDPALDPYDRYEPALHKLASALVQDWCDEIFFATYSVQSVKTSESFGQAKHKGVSDGSRVIRTQERPAHVAKNRLALPLEIPLDYRVYAAFLRGETPPVASSPEPEPETQSVPKQAAA